MPHTTKGEIGKTGTPIRPPASVIRPIPPGTSQPKYVNIMNDFKKLVLSSMPGFNTRNIFELVNTTVREAKAKMQSIGVSDLSQVGHVRLDRPLKVDRPGLIGSNAFVTEMVSTLGRKYPGMAASHIGAVNTHNTLLFSPLPFANQTESVILADELDLRNQPISIDRNTVSHLWIIARTIKAGPSAVINYVPLTNPAVGIPGTPSSSTIANPNYDIEARQSSTGGYATNGGNGNPGGDGKDGPKGDDAPDLTICAFEIDSMPDIHLAGQKGGRGGTGGFGDHGGNGMRGRDSKSIGVDCTHGPGYGGNGGNGGNGGRGGRGGCGGDGGNVVIATLQDQITPLLTARAFTIENGGGAGGDPGAPGEPGRPGKGGKAGHRTHWPCQEKPDRHGDVGIAGVTTGDLGSGTAGSPGTIGYEILTRENWESTMERPWITRLVPSFGFAGSEVAIEGLHFVNPSIALIHGSSVPATFSNDRKLKFTVPQNFGGGEHLVQARTPDGDLSNEVPFRVQPFISGVQVGGTTTATVVAEDIITIVGRSFIRGAGVYSNGKILQTVSVSQTEIRVTVPPVMGLDIGEDMRLCVQNPDGQRSNLVTVKRLPSLDSGFRAGTHGYAFQNFRNGKDGWGSFCDTFGTTEVGGNLIQSKILTGAFYLFFRWFLKGGGAHCSGMASTSLRKYHRNPVNMTYAEGPSSNENPPPISDELMRELDVAQGRVLSDELITHYADQGSEGLARVERTIRDIEEDFLNRIGENSARVLSLIPSGNIWDAFTDSSYRDAFMNAHCVVPTRLIYPDAARNLDGAKLFVYDSNRPGIDTAYIELFKQNGKIHFKYAAGNHTFSSANGFTLGTATLQKQLIDDVDMPLSRLFILDLMLSPAHISIEDANGKILGYKDGKMHSDRSLGYVCPWLENFLLVRDATEVKRTVIGNGDGTYTYATIHPAGKSLLVNEASCSARTKDVILVKPDFSKIEIETNETKRLDLHIGERIVDGSVRYLNVAFDIKDKEKTRIEMAAGIDGTQVFTPNRSIDVTAKTSLFSGTALVEERELQIKVPAGKILEFPTGMWSNLQSFDLTVR